MSPYAQDDSVSSFTTDDTILHHEIWSLLVYIMTCNLTEPGNCLHNILTHHQCGSTTFLLGQVHVDTQNCPDKLYIRNSHIWNNSPFDKLDLTSMALVPLWSNHSISKSHRNVPVTWESVRRATIRVSREAAPFAVQSVLMLVASRHYDPGPSAPIVKLTATSQAKAVSGQHAGGTRVWHIGGNELNKSINT